MCTKLETQEAFDSYRLETILNEYQNMIAILLAFLETQPKDTELSIILKRFVCLYTTFRSSYLKNTFLLD
jgi:hypothetical protein